MSPGVDMRLKAMHHFTSKLPLVERSERSMAGEQFAIATSLL
ncbi:MAG: hypothetical protein R2825_12825 [Saprospiraceae bacterium]